MQWLDRLIHGFIMTFGITQPSPEKRRLANFFIGFLLFAVVFGILGVVFFGAHYLAH